MKRLLSRPIFISATLMFGLVCSSALLTSTAHAAEVEAETVTQTQPVDAAACVSADEATFKHDFNGAAGTATVTLQDTQVLCLGEKQPFTLVSYLAQGPKFSNSTPQFMHDFETDVITDKIRSITLDVKVPPCYTQVDLIWGDKTAIIPVVTQDASTFYKGILLGNTEIKDPRPGDRSTGKRAAYNGGTVSCKAKLTAEIDVIVCVLPGEADIIRVVVENPDDLTDLASTFSITINGETRTIDLRDGLDITVDFADLVPGTYTATLSSGTDILITATLEISLCEDVIGQPPVDGGGGGGGGGTGTAPVVPGPAPVPTPAAPVVAPIATQPAARPATTTAVTPTVTQPALPATLPATGAPAGLGIGVALLTAAFSYLAVLSRQKRAYSSSSAV